MSKFKKGDRVFYTVENCSRIPYGTLGVVYSIRDNSLIEFLPDDGVFRWVVSETDIELFEPKFDDTNKSASETQVESTRDYNVGNSNYAEFKIQPWDIWLEYKLNPWDADIIKRTLRTKKGEERKLDYEKIIHICKERIRQLDS